ncbi:hypothetical protein ACVTYA_05805 [Enterococcus hirae]
MNDVLLGFLFIVFYFVIFFAVVVEVVRLESLEELIVPFILFVITAIFLFAFF